MMYCIKCNGRSKTNDSRYHKDGRYCYRRHECMDCGYVFSTKEFHISDATREKRLQDTLAALRRTVYAVEALIDGAPDKPNG